MFLLGKCLIYLLVGTSFELVYGVQLSPYKHSEDADDMDRGYDEQCDPHNCNQEIRPYVPGDQPFLCQLGKQKECDLVEETLPEGLYEPYNINYVEMSFISLYPRKNSKFGPYPYRALNFSIQLPHGDSDAIKAYGIYLTFSSPPGELRDSHYSKSHRCRYFDFSSTKLTEVDLKNPRELNYACFVGLDDTMIKHEYIINITVIPYQAFLTYYITTYNHLEGEIRKLTTGVAMIPLTNQIQVVYEKYEGHGDGYNITLYYNSQVQDKVKVNREIQHYKFKVKKDGYYHIGVQPISYQQSTIQSNTSVIFISTTIPTSLTSFDIKYIISILASVILAVIIMVITYIIIRNRGNKLARTTHIEDNSAMELLPIETVNMGIYKTKDVFQK